MPAVSMARSDWSAHTLPDRFGIAATNPSESEPLAESHSPGISFVSFGATHLLLMFLLVPPDVSFGATHLLLMFFLVPPTFC
jgi:hypothetical protein